MATQAPLKVVSWNLLATRHTRHNSAFHGGAAGTPESDAQRGERYSRNSAQLAALGAHVLLLQECDSLFLAHLAVVQPHYSCASHFINYAKEGTALLLDNRMLGFSGASTVDFGKGKSAAFAHVFAKSGSAGAAAAAGGAGGSGDGGGSGAAGSDGVWFASMHLEGGPGTQDVRVKQIGMLVEALRGAAAGAVAETPIVLAGDMNDEKPQALLDPDAGLAFVTPEGLITGLSSDFARPRRIDHVGASNVGARLIVPGSIAVHHAPRSPWEMPLGPIGSDHVPVTFDVVLGAPPSA